MTARQEDQKTASRLGSKKAKKPRNRSQTAPAEVVITPAQYLDAIALPTVAEFLNDLSDPRRAYLACVVTAHLVDQLTRSEKVDKPIVRERIAAAGKSRMEALEIVEGIANGTKHAGTGRGEPFPFASGYEEYAPGFTLGAPGSTFNEMGFDHRAGLIVRHRGNSVFVDDCVRLVIEAFRVAYPARFSAAEPF